MKEKEVHIFVITHSWFGKVKSEFRGIKFMSVVPIKGDRIVAESGNNYEVIERGFIMSNKPDDETDSIELFLRKIN